MKNPLTLAGIELATYRFVAQHLNHALPWKTKIPYFEQPRCIIPHKSRPMRDQCIWADNIKKRSKQTGY